MILKYFEIDSDGILDHQKLIREALKAWDERDTFVEEHKSDHVISYFWIKYNDVSRYFNPHQKLREMVNAMQ